MEFHGEKAAKDFLRKKGFREVKAGVWRWQEFRAYITPFSNRRNYGGRSGSTEVVDSGYHLAFHPYEPENAAESHTKLRERIGGKAYQ